MRDRGVASVEFQEPTGELSSCDKLPESRNMKTKEKLSALYGKLDGKCVEQFGFNIKDVTFNKIMEYMYTPKDSSSLAVTRILFGLAMLFDIPDERGGATMVKRWGDPLTCHFPLLPVIQPLPLPYMAMVYAAMWFGALGIMLGYKFRLTAPMFTACYWYLFLIEKSFWNNHSYLFGLVGLLISCTEANCYWSIDCYQDPTKKRSTVPYWNYFVLKYQFFILYFMAGMKKGTAEWLTGYSVQNLSEHWVFDPFKYFMTVQQTDYLVVHWFVFMFDLTVALWMMWAYTRHVAMVFCALFHLMNSRLFRIGMFPWVCLATMPLFYPFDWPKIVASYTKNYYNSIKNWIHDKIAELKKKIIWPSKKIESDADIIDKGEKNDITKCEDIIEETFEELTDKSIVDHIDKYEDQDNGQEKDDVFKDLSDDSIKKKRTIILIACFVFIQAFLPFSHFITKGYNNWTNGLYGYSWDMMVHSWDNSAVVVKVVDNDSKEEIYIDPDRYTLNDRWSRHGDMVYQYAQCLENNIDMLLKKERCSEDLVTLKNISIYVDVWCGMNGRFVQRMFDPKVDILRTTWSPFHRVPFLMPLLDEAVHWRKDLDEIRKEVNSWSNYSDVVFYADFPDYEQEKYIPLDFKNVTLTVLEGVILFEPEVVKNRVGKSYKLNSHEKIKVTPGTLHKVINIGENSAFYMYTFFNVTEPKIEKDLIVPQPRLPILKELYRRLYGMSIFANSIINHLFEIFSYFQCN